MAVSFDGSSYLKRLAVETGIFFDGVALSFWYYHDGSSYPSADECIFNRGHPTLDYHNFSVYVTPVGSFKSEWVANTAAANVTTTTTMGAAGWYHVLTHHVGGAGPIHLVYLNGAGKDKSTNSANPSTGTFTTIGARRTWVGFPTFSAVYVDKLSVGHIAEVCEWEGDVGGEITEAQWDEIALSLYNTRRQPWPDHILSSGEWRYWPLVIKEFKSFAGWNTTLTEVGTVGLEDHIPMPGPWPVSRWLKPAVAAAVDPSVHILGGSILGATIAP